MSAVTAALRDKAAERAVLAGIFKFGEEAFYDVVDLLNPDTFTINSNTVIYQCLKHKFESNKNFVPDLPSVLSAAKELGLEGLFEKQTELEHMNAIAQFPVSIQNVRMFAAKIRKLQIARLLHEQLEGAQGRILEIQGTEPVVQILGIAEDAIFDFSSLLNDNDNEPKKLGEGIEDYLQHLIDNPVTQLGIPTGFPEYDRAIGGGLRRGTVNIIGARTKTGKTFLTDSMGYHIAKTYDMPVLNLDTEMQGSDHKDRTLAMLSGVAINDIETGQIGKDPYKLTKVREAAKGFKSIPYFHKSIAGAPFEEIIATMRRWIVKEVGLDGEGKAKPCVIIYDYLKLMDASEIKGDIKEYQLLGFMMTALHNFSVRYDVPFLTLMQLNRDGIDSEKNSAAAGSDRIVWLCSNFTIFKRKSDEEIAEDGPENGTHKMVVTDARHGSGMMFGDYINVDARLWCGQIKELGLKSQAGKKSAKGFSTEIADDDKIAWET
jgi:replicative DNA helicase